MSLPLTGIRVADFSRVLAGPYCSMLLADLGAEVIKVEHPDGGDETRAWGPPYLEGESAYYLSINRNKRSITLNLKDAADQKLAYTLIKRSQVMLHNFKQGDEVKLDLAFETVKSLNPTIIYAHISSFGSTGPEAHKLGYDLLAQAVTGFMSITGSPEGEPSKVGVAVIDVLAGLNTALAIIASLYAQKTEAKARVIESSLLEAGLSALVNVASSYLLTGNEPRRYGNAHANIVPYQQFQTADKPMVIAAANERQFTAFARALGQESWLKDERFASNGERVKHRDEVVPIIQRSLEQRPRAYWLGVLDAANVPCAPVNTLPEVFSSEQVKAREMILRTTHPKIPELPLVAGGFKLDGQPTPLYRHPPLLGEHDEELRGWLEHSEEP